MDYDPSLEKTPYLIDDVRLVLRPYIEDYLSTNKETHKIYQEILIDEDKSNKYIIELLDEVNVLEYLRTTELFTPLHRYYNHPGINIHVDTYNIKKWDPYTYYHQSDQPWFKLKNTNNYLNSSSEEDDEIKEILNIKEKKENKIIEGCIVNIKKELLDPKKFFNKYFKKNSEPVKKLLNLYQLKISEDLSKVVGELNEKYMGLNPSLFVIEKNDVIKTYLEIKDYLNNPDTFKCTFCLETNTYETTLDYCCVRNSCLKCYEQNYLSHEKCPVCRKKLTKDTVYLAGSMDINRPLIICDCENNTGIFDYRCECCSGCPICEVTLGGCGCKVYDKHVINYHKNNSIELNENHYEINNGSRIFRLTGPMKYINGDNIKNCSHSPDKPCIPPYFGHSLINHYKKTIGLSDVFILTFNPGKMDCYASFAEWGIASQNKKTLYILPSTGITLSKDLWWYAIDSIKSINKLTYEKKQYHTLILNSINPEIRSIDIYLRMLDNACNDTAYSKNT